MARNVLAVPATSVSVERLFSQGRNAVDYHRHNLKAETILDMIILRGANTRKRKEHDDRLDRDYKKWVDLETLKADLASAENEEFGKGGMVNLATIRTDCAIESLISEASS